MVFATCSNTTIGGQLNRVVTGKLTPILTSLGPPSVANLTLSSLRAASLQLKCSAG